MSSYDLYGWEFDELDDVKDKIEKLLNIKFDLHESTYHGGDYYLYGTLDEENFTLERNIEFDDEPTEPEFIKYKILLYVNRTNRSTVLRDKIETNVKGAKYLRHENIISK